jgi:hypothetical protein
MKKKIQRRRNRKARGVQPGLCELLTTTQQLRDRVIKQPDEMKAEALSLLTAAITERVLQKVGKSLDNANRKHLRRIEVQFARHVEATIETSLDSNKSHLETIIRNLVRWQGDMHKREILSLLESCVSTIHALDGRINNLENK